MNNWALLAIAALFITSPTIAQDQPCLGADSGISDAEPSPDELAYIAKRFELVCHTRNPEQGLRPLRLFTEPNLKSAISTVMESPMTVDVDMFVDHLVEADGEQFLGGTVFAPTRCPVVQFDVPDGKGAEAHFDHWYMLATDLDCELRQPGEP